MVKTVTTKFDIGDKVYSVYCFAEFYPIRQPFVIKDILVNMNSRKTTVQYTIKQNNYMDQVPEEWVFATYEECTKWCEKHN
jgi:hypothetical protein